MAQCIIFPIGRDHVANDSLQDINPSIPITFMITTLDGNPLMIGTIAGCMDEMDACIRFSETASTYYKNLVFYVDDTLGNPIQSFYRLTRNNNQTIAIVDGKHSSSKRIREIIRKAGDDDTSTSENTEFDLSIADIGLISGKDNIRITSDSEDILEGISGSKIYTFSYECGNFGKIIGRTEYAVIEDSTDSYNFYMAHYRLQGLPYSGHSKSLLGVISDVDADSTYGQYQTLLEYGPTTSSGTSTVEFSAGITAGYGGSPTATADFHAPWPYSLSDTSSIDHSDYSINYFNVDYDINKCTNTGYNIPIVEPCLVSAVGMNGDGNYHVTDVYKAQFCNVVIHGAWHNTFTIFTYPVDVVMYR